jgi:hypothetical protein
MLLGVGGMTGLLSWCVVKVLTTPGTSEHVHSPADIDTQDVEKD